MIEVELKFTLTESEEICLLKGATFIEEQEFIDVYYDDKDYNLSTRDIWLRTRNDQFVLKMPIPTDNLSLKEQRNTPKLEIEDKEDILRHLKILPNKGIYQDLMNHGINPLYKFRNIRKKYTKENFIIDLDKAFFEDFTYETCEIELVVDREEYIYEATQKIEAFAKKHNMQVGRVEGRLIEYIRRKNPTHYQMLMNV